ETASMLALSCPAAEGEAVNRIALPSGRTCGQRWVASPEASLVNSCHAPPAPGIRDRGSEAPAPATMVPSWPQLAPTGEVTPVVEARFTGTPPWTEIFLS